MATLAGPRELAFFTFYLEASLSSVRPVEPCAAQGRSALAPGMARDEQAGSLADANGSMEGAPGAEAHSNGPLANGGARKLTAAEREQEKRRRAAARKKHKKAAKQAERCAPGCPSRRRLRQAYPVCPGAADQGPARRGRPRQPRRKPALRRRGAPFAGSAAGGGAAPKHHTTARGQRAARRAAAIARDARPRAGPCKALTAALASCVPAADKATGLVPLEGRGCGVLSHARGHAGEHWRRGGGTTTSASCPRCVFLCPSRGGLFYCRSLKEPGCRSLWGPFTVNDIELPGGPAHHLFAAESHRQSLRGRRLPPAHGEGRESSPCARTRQPEVEVEYVSAPREYEGLLGTSDGAAAMDTDGPLGDDGPAPRGGLGAGAAAGGGLGFVAAGAAVGDGGVGGAGGGAGLGLGFTPGLGAGGATPGLGLGSDWGGETPGGAGLGLGATPRLGADADAGAPSASAVRPLVEPIAREGRRVSYYLSKRARKCIQGGSVA